VSIHSDVDTALPLGTVTPNARVSPMRRRVRKNAAAIAYPLVGFAGLIILWGIAVELFRIPRFLLPSPLAVLQALTDNAPVLIGHSQHTGSAILIGFVLSVVFAIPMAIIIAFSKVLSQIIYPLLVTSQSIPKVALAPLILIWLGFGIQTSITVAFLISFFPIIINTVLGLKSMPVELKYLAQSMGAGPFRTFVKIRMPYALPYIFGGMKVAITLAVVGAVVGEFVGSNRGLGYHILVSSASVRTDLMFADIVILSALAIVLFLVVQALEALLVPWPRNRSQ
jgi:NitT/TauT family transport system permease protein